MIGGMFILFLVLLLLNVPIAFSLGASSLFYLLTSNMNAAVLAQKFYAGIDSFTLLCIPGFMLAGALMNGGGPIGLIVANIAKSRGATVIVSEPNESRLAMAKDFGADYSINPMKEDLDAFINKLTDGEGVNVIFEAAGIPALLAHATSQLSPAGRLVAMTFGKEPIPVNFKEINAKELTILGTRHQYQKFPEVVKILPDHLKEVDEITTHVFKAEDFQKAFDTLADRNSGAGKVVLTFA